MRARSRSCGSTASSAPPTRPPIAIGSTRSRCSRSPAIRTPAIRTPAIRTPAIRTPATPWPSRSVMSHHFDYPSDETLDITDAYCFDGAGDILSDILSPRTVFGMNTSPFTGDPWNSAGYYELKIDTNGDYVEYFSLRPTFPIGSDGTQHVRVEQLTGAAATSRTASGTLITPPNAPIGEVVECSNGIKLFAGPRLDPFRNFIPYPVATTNSLS